MKTILTILLLSGLILPVHSMPPLPLSFPPLPAVAKNPVFKKKTSSTPQTSTVAAASMTTSAVTSESLLNDPPVNSCSVLPPFTSPLWITQNIPGHSLPWGTDNVSITKTNGPGAQSYPGIQMPAAYIGSTIYIVCTNDVDSYGNSMAHQLGFRFEFDKDVPGDVFKCSVASLPGDDGIFHTNLSASTLWTMATCIIPPFPPGVSNMILSFTVYKSSTHANAGPTGFLDPYITWCKISGPLPVVGDFQVKMSGGKPRLEWNAAIYTTNIYHLLSGPTPLGPYTLNKSPVTVSNTTAYVSIGTMTNRQYFKLSR